MNNKKFQKEAQNFDRDTYEDLAHAMKSDSNLRLLHAQMGISGEAGELTDAIKKSIFYGQELDIKNVKEECGDILWYMAILLNSIGSSFDEIMTLNNEKLKKRYPNGFTKKNATLRLDKKESK